MQYTTLKCARFSFDYQNGYSDTEYYHGPQELTKRPSGEGRGGGGVKEI